MNIIQTIHSYKRITLAMMALVICVSLLTISCGVITDDASTPAGGGYAVYPDEVDPLVKTAIARQILTSNILPAMGISFLIL